MLCFRRNPWKDVATALAIVTYNPRYASTLIEKLLKSAVANAENNNGMKAENLSLKSATQTRDLQ